MPRLPVDIDELPTRNVGRFVERLARAYGIQYRRSGLDDFAEAVTRAASDDVELDLTGQLLVALKKQDRINGRQFARLMANHIREIRRVRPVRGYETRGYLRNVAGIKDLDERLLTELPGLIGDFGIAACLT